MKLLHKINTLSVKLLLSIMTITSLSAAIDIQEQLTRLKEELSTVGKQTTELKNKLQALRTKLGTSPQATTKPPVKRAQPSIPSIQPAASPITYQQLNTQYLTQKTLYDNQHEQVTSLPQEQQQIKAQCLALLDKQWNYLHALFARLQAFKTTEQLTAQQARPINDLLSKIESKQKEVADILSGKVVIPAETPASAQPPAVISSNIPTPPPLPPVVKPGNVPPPPPLPKAPLIPDVQKKGSLKKSRKGAAKPASTTALTVVEEIRISKAVIDAIKQLRTDIPAKTQDEILQAATQAAITAGATQEQATPIVQKALEQSRIQAAVMVVVNAYKEKPRKNDAEIVAAATQAAIDAGATAEQATQYAQTALATEQKKLAKTPLGAPPSSFEILEKAFAAFRPALTEKTPEEEAAEEAAEAAEWD